MLKCRSGTGTELAQRVVALPCSEVVLYSPGDGIVTAEQVSSLTFEIMLCHFLHVKTYFG